MPCALLVTRRLALPVPAGAPVGPATKPAVPPGVLSLAVAQPLGDDGLTTSVAADAAAGSAAAASAASAPVAMTRVRRVSFDVPTDLAPWGLAAGEPIRSGGV